LAEVREIIREELDSYPEDLFDEFSAEPIASASLAQVHTAFLGGRKVAVKVQHPSVGRTAFGDIFVMTKIVRYLERFVEGFTFGWLVDEIAPQLFLELDFENESQNGRKAKKILEKEFGDRVVVPGVVGELTKKKVLTMDWEGGLEATDIEGLEREGLDKGQVARLVSEVFCYQVRAPPYRPASSSPPLLNFYSQVFQEGFVHCDPHPANLMVRTNSRTGRPQLVLVDHGLYERERSRPAAER
jgi:aarF domain-containing kinase